MIIGLAVVSWARIGLVLVSMATVALQTIFGSDNRPPSWSKNLWPGTGAQTGSKFSMMNVCVYAHVCLGNARFVPRGPAVTGNPIDPTSAGPPRGDVELMGNVYFITIRPSFARTVTHFTAAITKRRKSVSFKHFSSPKGLA